MAGHGSHAPTTAVGARPSTAANDNNPALDYINGHGNLPDAPAPNAAPTAPAAPVPKKGKNKKAPDPNETGKLLAAKINQLELDAAGEKDQEAEIGGYSSTHASRENVLASMRKHDLPQDMIAEVAKAFDEGAKVSMVEKGLPSLETMESLLANFSLTSPALDLPRIYETLFNRPLPMNAMDQQKLTQMPPGLFADIEREVKKATRDLSNLLNGMETPLQKMEALQKKYTELLAEMKRVDRENAKNKKRSELLQKEKDQSRSELSKTNSMKEKLEKLCRELQRDNKKLKVSLDVKLFSWTHLLTSYSQDEQKKIEDSERRSREDFSDRTESLFWDVNDNVERIENPDSQKSNVEVDELWVTPLCVQSFLPRDTDSDPRFRQKFKSFVEQYELRELHFYSLMRTKECEIQLSQARAEEQRKRAEAETTKSRTLSAQVNTFSQTESELRSQLNIYVEKFKQASSRVFLYKSMPLPLMPSELVVMVYALHSLSMWSRELLLDGNTLVNATFITLILILDGTTGRGHPQQFKRPLPDLPQGNGRDVQEDQAPRKGKPQPNP